MRLLIFVLCISTRTICLDAWGRVGHSIVARLAQSQLNSGEMIWLNDILPWFYRNNLSEIASWSDDILYPDSNPTGYLNWRWSTTLHYINTPDWACEYNRIRDCVNDSCIEGAIRNYTKRLETEWDHYQRQEALYFLVHFVGDIHQPLHSGFAGDRGGNSIRGKLFNSTSLTNLHTMWDTTLITKRIRDDFGGNASFFYEYIYEIMQKSTSTENDDQIEQWIKENIRLVCNQIYENEDNGRMNTSTNFTLGEKYYNRSIPIIEQRLADGGRRLGALLKRLAQKSPKAPEKEKLSSGMIALIVIVSLESALILVIAVIFLYRFLTKNRSNQRRVLAGGTGSEVTLDR